MMPRRGMLAAVLTVFGSLLGSGVVATSAKAACQVKEFAELKVNAGSGVPLVASQINGHPALLMADTGSNVTLLWRGSAVDLGLKPKSLIGVDAYGSGKQLPIQALTIHSLQIGNYDMNNIGIFILDDKPFIEKTAGLIGDDLLSAGDVEFDLPENVIRLLKPVGCKGDQVVFWNKAYSSAPLVGFNIDLRRFYTMVVINGKPIEAMINTGVEASQLPGILASRLGVKVDPKPSARSASNATASSRTYLGRMDSFGFGDEVIKNTTIQVVDEDHHGAVETTGSRLGEVAPAPDMVLGADFFRAHRVLIAKSQNMIYFSYMGGPVFDLTGSTKSAASTSQGGMASNASEAH